MLSQDFMIKWYTEAAEQGNAVAQFTLGKCYFYGEGVEQDKQNAVEWYTRAAEQGRFGLDALDKSVIC